MRNAGTEKLPLEAKKIIYECVVGGDAVEVHLHNGTCRSPNRDPLKFRSKTRPNTHDATQSDSDIEIISRDWQLPVSVASSIMRLPKYGMGM
jgi:hypothetical protein